MSLPELSAAATRLYDQVAHLDREQDGYPWAHVCKAIAAPRDALYDLLTSTSRPWERAYDIDNAPGWILPWLANFTGAVLTPNMTEDQQRDAIRNVDAGKRGGVEALRIAGRRSLTGEQTLLIFERQRADQIGDFAYSLYVVTRASETENRYQVAADLLSQKPAGLRLDHYVVDGVFWNELEGTWDEQEGTWDELLVTGAPLLPGSTTYPSDLIHPKG